MSVQIDLDGKTAVVTGASGQLGRAITRSLAQAGADVAIHYHANESGAAKLLAEVRDLGVSATSVQADITDQDSVNAMRQTVVDTLGVPDIIVNNAVIQYDWTSILDQRIEDYESQFRSCVLQSVLMAKAFVPAMIAKRWGRVIAINTECAAQCTPMQSAYASAKRGLDGIVRVLAREVGPYGITVNQVAPGWMISDSFREAATIR